MIEVMFPRRSNSEVRCPVPRFTPYPFVQPTARVIRVGVIADENSVHPPTNSAVTGSVCGAFFDICFNTIPYPACDSCRSRVLRVKGCSWVSGASNVRVIKTTGIKTPDYAM